MASRSGPTVQQYRRAALRSAAAQAVANAAFQDGLRDRDPAAYDALLKVFWSASDAAFEGLFDDRNRPIHDDIDLGDRSAIEIALRFLEADGTCFRSGYHKSALIRRLKRAALTAEDLEAVERIVASALRPDSRMPLRELAALARRLPGAVISQRLMALCTSPAPGAGSTVDPLRAAVLLSHVVAHDAPEQVLVRAIIRAAAIRRTRA